MLILVNLIIIGDFRESLRHALLFIEGKIELWLVPIVIKLPPLMMVTSSLQRGSLVACTCEVPSTKIKMMPASSDRQVCYIFLSIFGFPCPSPDLARRLCCPYS